LQSKRERADGIDRADDEARARKADREAAERSNGEALKKGTEVVTAVRDLRERLVLEQALAQRDAAAAQQAGDAGHGIASSTLAAVRLLAGETTKALELLQKDKDEHQNQVPPLARLVLALHAAGEHERAKAAFEELRTVGGRADLAAPLLQRLQPVAAALGLPTDWRLPQAPAADTRADERPPLDELGPFRWQPQPAPGFDLVASDGVRHRLGDSKRPTLVVFYLGFGCPHCVEQLKALAPHARAFAAAGIDVVAIGTDRAAAAAAAVAALKDGERPPFQLLADPELAAFKAWRCHDDFESMPLHGTFLVDADGRVRWQDIGFEPFTKIEWLLAESRRLLGMPAAAGSK
jgi:peroxiredoxin